MGGLGQGFAASWHAGQQLMNQRQELEIRKKESDLRAKLFDLEWQKIQRGMQSGDLIREELAATQPRQTTAFPAAGGQTFGPDEEAAAFAPRTPTPMEVPGRPVNRRTLAEALAIGNPEAAAKLALEPEPTTLEEQLGTLRKFGVLGGGQPSAAPAPPAAPAPGPAGPPGAALAMPAPVAPQGAVPGAPEIRFDLGPKGVTLHIGPKKYEIKDTTIEVQPGVYQHFREVIDPATGQPIDRRLVGGAVPPAEVIRNESVIRSWGVDPRTPLGQYAMGLLSEAIAYQDPNVQNLAIQKAKAAIQAMGGRAGGLTVGEGGPLGPGLLGEAQSLRAEGEAKTTAARETAQRLNQPLQGADRAKYEALQSAERSAMNVLQTYDPRFVGKGFARFKAKYQAEFERLATEAAQRRYVPGAIAGSVREFLGNISPEEVTFRRALLDASDILLRARSGAQINEAEFRRLSKMLGQLSDEPAVFEPAMRRFIGEVRSQIDDVLKGSVRSAEELRRERQGAPAPTGRGPRILSIEPVR